MKYNWLSVFSDSAFANPTSFRLETFGEKYQHIIQIKKNKYLHSIDIVLGIYYKESRGDLVRYA